VSGNHRIWSHRRETVSRTNRSSIVFYPNEMIYRFVNVFRVLKPVFLPDRLYLKSGDVRVFDHSIFQAPTNKPITLCILSVFL
jgi:hypothetical protein